MNITRLYFNSLFVFTILLFATQAFAFEGRPANIKCTEDVVVREILGPK
jgi:hypothetical protein